MRLLPCLASLSFVAAAACGSSNELIATSTDPTATSLASCNSAQDCNPDQCVCTDGEAISAPTVCIQNSCGASSHDSFCANVCADHGGVSAIRPAPNVATSVECDAWCNEGAGLGCGSTRCDRFFFCGVGKRSCAAAAKASLKCAVEKGTWACSAHGDSWSVTSSCPTFEELCAH